jgi:hypothetical protein
VSWHFRKTGTKLTLMVPTAVVVRLVSTKSTYPALAHVKRMKEITIHRTMFQHRVLPPFQRNWHKNHDGLWCSPYHHLVPTNTLCISRRHFRSCTFHNTCRSLGPWLFCTQKHLPALSIFAFSMCMFFSKSHSSGLASSFLHVVSNWSISCWCFFTIIWRKRLW